QLPRYTGYATQTDNIGSIENKGLEFSINSTNTIGEFQWSTIANLTINRNKVLSLGEDRFFTRNANTTMADYNSAVIVEVDKPLGSFFGYVFDGIYQTEEEVASIDHPGARPGAVKFRDVNQDG